MPPARIASHLAVAVASALLLASCSTTSEPMLAAALQPPAPSAASVEGAAADGTAQPAGPDAIASAEAATPYSFVGEDDPALPQKVLAVPAPSPAQTAEAASATDTAPTQSEIAAVFDSRSGPAETAARTAEPASGPAPAEPAKADALAATAYLENRAPEAAQSGFVEPKKRGFFASLFSSAQAAQAPQRRVEPRAQAATTASTTAAPLVQLAATGPVVQIDTAAPRTLASVAPLPGVRADNLFEINRKSGTHDDSDIDLHEDDEVKVASAAGLARLAPNGLLTQTDRVDVACLKPSLLRVIKTIEAHYGRKAVITSGYRSPPTNRRARGARNSLHMYCAAADIQIEGVSKWELATYLRAMPGRGGVGTYCHTNSVHVDVGPERDWDWRCRRRKK